MARRPLTASESGPIAGNYEDLVLRHVQELVFLGAPVSLAQNLSVGTSIEHGELSGILLVLQRDDRGVFAHLTPDGARAVAGQLLKSAEKAEAESAERVRTALAAIRKGARR